MLRSCVQICVFNQLENYLGHFTVLSFFRTFWELDLLFPLLHINDPTQCSRWERASITDENNISIFRIFDKTQYEAQYAAEQYREKDLYSDLCLCYVMAWGVKVVMCVIVKQRVAFITSCSKATQELN